MVTFLVCVGFLVISYFTYARFLERKLGLDFVAKTPAERLRDGVDYIPLSKGRTFLIQLLNISGMGPVFGALLGAAFGPVSFVWITLGAVFMGAVHDFALGAVSLHNDGLGFPELVGRYLGPKARVFMGVFTLLLLLTVGALFTYSPAELMAGWTTLDRNIWLALIIVYYLLATILPIDKIIGRLYPFFGLMLLAMSVLVLATMFFGDYDMIEITGLDSLRNMHYKGDSMPLFPMLFVTIACGSISGFHATQSPIMARCLSSEKYARPVFFGAMVTESIIALIWAAVGMCFFGGVEQLGATLNECNGSALYLIKRICVDSFGLVGGSVVIAGAIAATITSGDTAFRMARITVADFFRLDQRSILMRVTLCLPLFLLALLISLIDFDITWRYMSWANQVIAAVALWSVCGYMRHCGRKAPYLFLPAVFMTFLSFLYIVWVGIKVDYSWVLVISGVLTIATSVLFYRRVSSNDMSNCCH